MKQERLEALKLAVTHGFDSKETLRVAAEYVKFIEVGPDVVPLGKPQGVLHISKKDKRNDSRSGRNSAST